MIHRVLLIAGLLTLLSPAVLSAQQMTAYDIVSKANDVLNQESSFGKCKMTINTTSGQKRDLYYDSWSKDKGKKSKIKYTAPRRVKDQAMLMLNNANEIWNYDPRTNRVRKLASHAKKQKMQGSDFSYEDMGSGDSFLTDFTHKKLEDEKKGGHDCFVVELTVKKDVASNYSRMIMWIEKSNYVIWSIDYYDEDDSALKVKTLTCSNLKDIDGVPTIMHLTMHNHLDNTSTSQEMIEIRYNLKIDDTMFTERGLKK